MDKLPYSDKVSAEYEKKEAEGCAEIGIQPAWLRLTVAIETAKTFKASIQNPVSKATGLIQFMKATAEALGTSLKELAAMSEEEQLDYVFKYFKPYRGRMHSFVDVYFAVFYPAAIGKPDSYMLGASPEMRRKISLQNSAYDLNKDAAVCVGEVKACIRKFIPKGFENLY